MTRRTWSHLAHLAEVFGGPEGRSAVERAKRAKLRLRNFTGMGQGVGRFKRPGDLQLSFGDWREGQPVTFVTQDRIIRYAA